MKYPFDRFPYPQDPRCAPLSIQSQDATYDYVQDLDETIMILPDGPHLHPKVLGGGKPALYAGDLTLDLGVIVDLTNLSGTFQFNDEAGLKKAAGKIRSIGLAIQAGAVRFFPADGSCPIVLE